jgi:uncharacterized protein (DUF1501 family)
MTSRRRFLELAAGAALAAGFASPFSRRFARANAGKQANAKACILLYMVGGPSQLDTFDPKPAIDGGVKAIATNVSGIRLAERLPLLAKQTDKLAIIRSLSSAEGNHERARHLMHTGYAPAGGVSHPALGSIVAAERSHGPLPGYVSINGPGASAGFLGAGHAPFAVINPTKQVRNLAPEPRAGISTARVDERIALWRELEDGFAAGRDSQIVRGQRSVGEQAVAMMKASQIEAFDVAKESSKTRERFGAHSFGTGCLMARRLVEQGVPFVEVMQRGWDTHTEHDERTDKLTRELDQGMSALLADLDSRGLLESTLVVWVGDFGRTPWLNARGGRDHYPAVTPAVLAGGGIEAGKTIGSTNKDGRKVASGAATVADLFHTVAEVLGLEPDEKRISRAGRPITTVDDAGSSIPGLVD